MIENKRFLIDDTGELIDLKNPKFIDYGDECCKLLNDLYDENQKLKEANQDLQYKIGEVTNLLHKEIKTSKNAFYGLMQENKELRQKIVQLKNKQNSCRI